MARSKNGKRVGPDHRRLRSKETTGQTTERRGSSFTDLGRGLVAERRPDRVILDGYTEPSAEMDAALRAADYRTSVFLERPDPLVMLEWAGVANVPMVPAFDAVRLDAKSVELLPRNKEVLCRLPQVRTDFPEEWERAIFEDLYAVYSPENEAVVTTLGCLEQVGSAAFAKAILGLMAEVGKETIPVWLVPTVADLVGCAPVEGKVRKSEEVVQITFTRAFAKKVTGSSDGERTVFHTVAKPTPFMNIYAPE